MPQPGQASQPPPPAASRDIRQYFNNNMNISTGDSEAPQEVSSASEILSDHQSSDDDDREEVEGMELEDSEESRKRRHSEDDSEEEVLRQPGNGSLLTNTSIRPRLSEVASPELTSTPDRLIDQAMANIRETTARVASDLPPVEESPQQSTSAYQDSSSASNIHRVQDVVDGIVNITRNVIHAPENSLSMTWDNEGLPTLQMISPRPVPNLTLSPVPTIPISPPPHSAPAPGLVQDVEEADMSLQTNTQDDMDMITVLKESFKETFQGAYKMFEDKIISNMTQFDGKVFQARKEMMENRKKIIRVETDLRVVSDAKDELAVELGNHTGHINRLEEGVHTIQVKVGLLEAMQERITALEAAAANMGAPANMDAPPTPASVTPAASASNSLTEDECKRLRLMAKRDEEGYYMSTLQLRGFYPPTNISKGSRGAAAGILRMMGVEDVLTDVVAVLFKDNNTKLRLTFFNTATCLKNLSYLNSSSRFCISNGESPPFKYSQLTPPRYEEQRKQLFDKAFAMRDQGITFRHVFVIRNDSLCLRISKKGERDTFISYSPPEETSTPSASTDQAAESMEIDETPDNQKCPICFDTLKDGSLSYLGCLHVFHSGCIKTSLEKTLDCPVCKQQDQEAPSLLQCHYCIQDRIRSPQAEDGFLVLSRKCGHLHTSECQTMHRFPIEDQFPLCPSSLEPLINSDVPGCRSCSRNLSSTDLSDRLLTKITFYPQISSFLDLTTVPTAAPDAPVPVAPAPVPVPDALARPEVPLVVDALPAQARINPTQDARPRGTVRNEPLQRDRRPQPRQQTRPQPLIHSLPAQDRRPANPRPRSSHPPRSYAETTSQSRASHGNTNVQQRSHQATGSNVQALGQRDRARHVRPPLLPTARAEDRRRR